MADPHHLRGVLMEALDAAQLGLPASLVVDRLAQILERFFRGNLCHPRFSPRPAGIGHVGHSPRPVTLPQDDPG